MKKGKKIRLIFGTRPEAIKMAPLYHKLRADPVKFDVDIWVTAQHREMLDQVLETFEIRPSVDLDLMKSNQGINDVTANVLLGLKSILEAQKPDLLLVHGDTSTTLAASMAGFFSKIDVGHIEAGLRTFDMQSPFPEEFNRQVVTKIARWHFAPTETSRQNLINEGVDAKNIVTTGNTVIDALQWTMNSIRSDSGNFARVDSQLLSKLCFDYKKQKFILITCHRRENLGVGLRGLCRAIRVLAKQFKDVHYVFPVHLNPNILNTTAELLGDIPNIHLVQPLNYELFVHLLSCSHLVLTDSGGIQEEAPSLGKPVLVIREITERPEAVQAGTVKIVGSDESAIIHAVTEVLTKKSSYEAMAKAVNPYGDGKACDRIVKFLETV